MLQRTLILAVAFGLFSHAAQATTNLSGYIEGELRYYPQPALFPQQADTFGSLALVPEYNWTNDSKSQSIRVKPFYRYGTSDGNRNHGDIREMYYTFADSGLQFDIGVNKVFWGVVESTHLVDVINQTDMVESINGKEKLGQPMISLGIEKNWGNLDVYVLPYFRERVFTGGDERFQIDTAQPINIDKTQWQSDRKERHIDFAARWSQHFGGLDVGVSHFKGTNRDPLPVLVNDINPQALYYEQLEQTGLELQYVIDSWAIKFESVNRQLDSGNYNAAVTGFEYTFSNVEPLFGADIGLLAEYLWNDRKDTPIYNQQGQEVYRLAGNFLSPFENDIFFGTRFTLSDASSTSFLAGAIYDVDKGTTVASFEGSTRLGDALRVSVNVYLFGDVGKDSSFYFYRKDDQLEVKLAWYF